MDDWLTEEDYEIAKANGISKNNLRQRYYDYGWDKERARTEKVKPRVGKLWLQYKDICAQNNVDASLFGTRVLQHGWTPERAANTPRMTREERTKILHSARRRKWDERKSEHLRLAEENGISYNVWYRRTKFLGWDPEKAATIPVKHRTREGVIK